MKNKNEVTGNLLLGCTVLRITREFPGAVTILWLDRNKLLLNSISTKPDTDHNKAPFCFATDYSLRKSRMNIAGALHANANLLPASLQQPRRLVAWKSAPKLRNLVTFRYNFPLLDEDGNLLPSS